MEATPGTLSPFVLKIIRPLGSHECRPEDSSWPRLRDSVANPGTDKLVLALSQDILAQSEVGPDGLLRLKLPSGGFASGILATHNGRVLDVPLEEVLLFCLGKLWHPIPSPPRAAVPARPLAPGARKRAFPDEAKATDRRCQTERCIAAQRPLFEQAVSRVQALLDEHKMERPTCYIAYAWGDAAQEHWVKQSLASDLQKADIHVALDRWDNWKIGASVPRFLERMDESDYVVVVGTPLYRKKYDNKDQMRPCVGAAEGDLIGKRMTGSEARKASVLPTLLSGTEETSLPPLLQGRVYADFRDPEQYFLAAFDLILTMCEIPPHDRAVANLRKRLGADRGDKRVSAKGLEKD